MADHLAGVALAIWVICVGILVQSLLLKIWFRPKRLEACLRKQGIKGPAPVLLAGNLVEVFRMRDAAKIRGMSQISHDIVPHVTPDVSIWSKLYGKPYISTWLHEPRITFFDPEACRTILSKEFDKFHKSNEQLNMIIDLLGNGIVGVNGDEWSQHRTVLSPAFQTQKLKAMLPSFQMCTKELITVWNNTIGHEEAEIELSSGLTKLAADAISHTAFGSSYEKGQRVFQVLRLLGESLAKLYRTSWLPFWRYHPRPLNLRIWKLRKEMDGILLELIKERRSAVRSGAKSTYGSDLLGLVLEESEGGGKKTGIFTDGVIVNECKTFYLAGHETTASWLTWSLLLLAINPVWQERARAEVQEHCVGGFYDGDALGKLKVVGMIVYETLRLYPAATEVIRAAKTDVVVSGIELPKGTGVVIPILSLQHDPELWGSDADEFNPERFAQGATKACKHPNAFIPFSFGPRVCIGQAFALMEVKIALAMLLRTFSFRVSPNYKHNPVVQLVLVPKHGLQLLVKKL